MNNERALVVRASMWLVMVSFLLPGCMAQQADVVRIQKELDARISDLDHSRTELGAAVTEANQALAQTQAVITEQRREIQALLRARADLVDQVTKLRDGELSRIHGDLDTNVHGIQTVTKNLEELRQNSESRHSASMQRTNQHETMLNDLTEQVKHQAEVIAAQSGSDEKFRSALLEFKDALDSVRNNVEQQQAQGVDLTRRMDILAQHTASESAQMTNYLTEVKQSVDSIVRIMQETNVDVTNRLEAHDRQLASLTESAQTSTLSLEEFQRHAEYVGELRQSMTQLQSGLALVVKTIGARVDAHERQLAKLTNRSSLPLQTQEVVLPAPPSSTESVHSPRNALSNDQYITNPIKSEDQEAYQQIQQKLQARNFQEALTGFSDFLKQYPSSPLAGNAQYWMGECFYGTRQFPRAIQEFERVVYHYPSSKKVPAALLKIGYAHWELRDRVLAKATFQQLVRSYAESPEAIKASARLTELE